LSSVPEISFTEAFGAFIQEGRIKKSLSQKEFAEILGITQPYLSRLELGLRCPDFELAVKICTVLGLNLNDFVSTITPNNPKI